MGGVQPSRKNGGLGNTAIHGFVPVAESAVVTVIKHKWLINRTIVMNIIKLSIHVGLRRNMAFLCLGCGENLTDHSENRRSLQGSEAERIVQTWRKMLEVLETDVEEEKLCIDTLLSGDVSKEKMCRKCFTGFDRYFKLHSSLQEKLLKAIKSQVHTEAQETVARKRRRLQASQDRESSHSPSVSVRTQL